MSAPPTFTDIPGLSLPGVIECSLAWGDGDNDGDLDLAVAGYTGSGYVTKVYENDGPLPNLLHDALAGSQPWGGVLTTKELFL